MIQIERTSVDFEGGTLEVFVSSGEGGGGPVIAAAHPMDPFNEQTVALLVNASRARVISVSPLGVGGSSPPERPEDRTLEGVVEQLEAVRGALGLGPWVFWGMSGGSMTGQVYARRHPEALAGLILASAGPCFRQTVGDPACVLSPRFPAWQAGFAAAGLTGATDEGAVGWEVASIAEETAWEQVPGVGWVFRRRGGPVLLVSPTEPSPQMQRMMPACWGFDARGWLGAVRVPTLVMCGTNDPVVPLAYGRAVHEAIAGSDFLPVQGAGHVPLTDRPAEVASTVRRFLAERVSRG
jgi:pimeloyl-ACP methyl ester carboxylesterase